MTKLYCCRENSEKQQNKSGVWCWATSISRVEKRNKNAPECAQILCLICCVPLPEPVTPRGQAWARAPPAWTHPDSDSRWKPSRAPPAATRWNSSSCASVYNRDCPYPGPQNLKTCKYVCACVCMCVFKCVYVSARVSEGERERRSCYEVQVSLYI